MIGDKVGEVSIEALNAMLRKCDFILQIMKK